MKKNYLFVFVILSFVAQSLSGQTVQRALSYVYEYWDGSAWKNSQRFLNTYNSYGFNTYSKYQSWNGSAWVDQSQTTSYGDASGNPTLSISQSWVSASSTWSNSSRFSTTYTTSGKALSQTSEYWDGNNWVNSFRFLNTYDNNLFNTTSKYQNWIGSAWIDISKTTISNNANGNATLSISQNWVSAASTWSNSSELSTTYTTSGKTLIQTGENWNGSAWENSYRFLNTYDNNVFNTLSKYQGWSNSAWLDISQTTSYPNASGNPTLAVIQNWIAAASTWSNSMRITYTYTDTPITIGLPEGAMTTELQLYPVPATNQLFIELSGQPESYTIIDLSGAIVRFSILSTGTNTIDINDLPAGIYFFRSENSRPVKIIRQ